MTPEDRALAGDCWLALSLLRHPSAQAAETPEWLALTAQCLGPAELPAALIPHQRGGLDDETTPVVGS